MLWHRETLLLRRVSRARVTLTVRLRRFSKILDFPEPLPFNQPFSICLAAAFALADARVFTDGPWPVDEAAREITDRDEDKVVVVVIHGRDGLG